MQQLLEWISELENSGTR